MIVAVGGWRGNGASTTALAVASCAALADEGAWLIEADPAGGVLSGRMHLAPISVGGLERVAFPTERASAVEILHEVAHQQAALRIVTAPADPFRAWSCHAPRMPWIDALGELPGIVVVDVGRLRAGSPVWALVRLADAVLVTTSPEVSAAVSASEWLHAEGRVAPTEPGLAGAKALLVVVAEPGGVAFPKSGLLADLGDRCAGWLPWEPAAVDLLHRGAAADDRRLRRSALVAAANRITAGLTSAAVAASPAHEPRSVAS